MEETWFVFSPEFVEHEFKKNNDNIISNKNGKNLKKALIFWNKVINSVFVQQKPAHNQEYYKLNNQAINYSSR